MQQGNNKRLVKELHRMCKEQISKPLLENDYLIHFDDADITKVYAIIKAPQESVYKHKFIRLDMDIPQNYPHSPPKVKFVNYDGVRIHPNFYEDGNCCSTILNTWGNDKYEKWTSSMGIETVVLTFHSFLDNNPYVYEPGDRDDPTYSVYVEHQTWHTCLLKYLQYEKIEIFRKFMSEYMINNIDCIFDTLIAQNKRYPYGYYFTKCFYIEHYIINYDFIIDSIQYYYTYSDFHNTQESDNVTATTQKNIKEVTFRCNICFDTKEECSTYLTTSCNHIFHKTCLEMHIENSDSICPMCRSDIYTDGIEDWIINPLTKRRVKCGGRTHRYLIENGHIHG
uniref:RING-type domain-containing protein n=1 Tax=viral metagenome TaxID=1070528 RepID=A0A6C0E1X9_9ZZZZ